MLFFNGILEIVSDGNLGVFERKLSFLEGEVHVLSYFCKFLCFREVIFKELVLPLRNEHSLLKSSLLEDALGILIFLYVFMSYILMLLSFGVN